MMELALAIAINIVIAALIVGLAIQDAATRVSNAIKENREVE